MEDGDVGQAVVGAPVRVARSLAALSLPSRDDAACCDAGCVVSWRSPALPRYFVLKDGFILYYAARAAPMAAFDVHPKGVIPLGGCR